MPGVGPFPGLATRVLVIARDPAARERALAHCRGLDMLSIDTVESIDAALSAPAATAIFIEVGTPDCLADELARLRHRHANAGVAVTSPQDNLEVRVAAARAGAHLFLVQPLGKHTIRDAIRQLVDHSSPRTPRVLIIDDDPDFVDVTQAMLALAGLQVVGLLDSSSLLNSLRQLRPDVVLVDLDMPRYDGIELTAMLRNSREFDNTPVLFISGNNDPQVIRRAFAAGADDFLVKPVSAQDLLARIAARIGRSRQLRLAAERDPLTGLLNRAPFHAALDNRTASCLRNHAPLVLCLIDLDRFKHVNDAHGHQSGDEVLAAFGHLVRQQFRAEDLKCRWGGEEFALAFPAQNDIRVVQKMVETLLKRFRALTFHGPTGEEFSVTFSAGVARMSSLLGDTDGLIRCADRRLYLAKQADRACVVSDG